MRIHVLTGRLSRKGVEAIFSTPRKGRNVQFLVGLLVLLIGIILCAAVGLKSQSPRLFGAPEIGLYLSVLLSSLGVCLVVVGGGICLSYSVFGSGVKGSQSLNHSDETSQDTQKDSEGSVRIVKGDGDFRRTVVKTQNVALAGIAFLQSCLVLALYSGLTDEYQSNSSMQLWIRSNLSLGQYFLNWPAALIVAALLGILLVQFLPGRRFSQ